MRRLVRGVFIVACLLVGVLLLIRAYFLVRGPDESWKQRTTPLPAETVKVLCERFHLGTQPSCSGMQAVYGPDFYSAIRDTFRPYEEYGIPKSEAASYAEVEQTLGVFRYACDPVVHERGKGEYFSCYYDLRGDRAFRIMIMFSLPEKRVWMINTNLGLDGE